MNFKLKRKVETPDIIRMVGIAILVCLLVWGGVYYTRTFLGSGGDSGSFLENLQASALGMRAFIVEERPAVGFAFIMFLQIMPVIISAVPSSLTSFVGGMIYGFWGGMFVTVVGAMIGSTISFFLARILGRRVLTLFVSRRNIDKIEKMLGGNTSTFILLFLYAIPSPKDFFSYFLGLTNMRFIKFALISAIGRIPGMVVTVYFGTLALGEEPNWALIIIVTSVAAVVSALVMVFSKKIISALKRNKEENEVNAP